MAEWECVCANDAVRVCPVQERDRALVVVAALEAEVAGLKRAQDLAWGTGSSIRYWERQCQKADRARDAALIRLGRMREALRSVEWTASDWCTACGQTRGHGHAPDCVVAKALA